MRLLYKRLFNDFFDKSFPLCVFYTSFVNYYYYIDRYLQNSQRETEHLSK